MLLGLSSHLPTFCYSCCCVVFIPWASPKTPKTQSKTLVCFSAQTRNREKGSSSTRVEQAVRKMEGNRVGKFHIA